MQSNPQPEDLTPEFDTSQAPTAAAAATAPLMAPVMEPLMEPVMEPLGPIAPHERIVLLDVLRGVALLGIFMVNMPLFAFTLFEGFGGPELADAGLRNQVGWWIVAVLFQFKFISMFSMLFGAGFIMQAARAASRGRGIATTYLRRLGVLFCIGLVHAFIIWYGDILVAYSITGLLLLPFARVGGKTLLAIGVSILLLSALVGGGLGALQYSMMASAPMSFEELSSASEPPRGFDAILQMQFNPMHPEWVDAESAAFRDGPFLDALAFRITLWSFAIISGMFSWLWHVVGMFFVGAGLMRMGFFDPRHAAARARCAWLVVPGLAFEFLATWLAARDGWSGSVLGAAVGGGHGPTAAMVTLGYVGLISIAVDAARGSNAAGAVVRFIANVGRMALTCYLGESLCAAALMYWWGLGWFGSVDRLTLIALVIAIWFALAIGANAWLRFFRMGPVEWIWRWGTYGGRK